MNLDGVELTHLRYFVAVAEELHFSRAAERAGVSQPPLTQQIRNLEARVGHALFERSTRRTELTAAGAALLPYARAALAEAGRGLEAARRVGRGEEGRLVVATPPSLMLGRLAGVLRAFRGRAPKVALQLREMSTAAIAEALAAGVVDVGFLRTPVVGAGLREVWRYKEGTAVVLPAGHGMAKKKLRLERLAEEPFVLFPRHLGAEFYDELLGACGRAGFEPRIVQEATQWPTIVSLVEAGMGVTLAPESLGRLRSRRCVFRELAGEWTTVVAACGERGASGAAGRFLALAREMMDPGRGKEGSGR